VINALKSKTKVPFVDGSLSKPETSSLEVHAWGKCNVMVVALLYNIINKNLHGSVAYTETASKI